jgi:hypothetical protein
MRYIRAFFLPIFGMGRTTDVHCTECGHVVKEANASVFAKKNYPQSIAAAIKDIRATHTRTLWQLIYPWSFWFLILALFLTAFIGAGIEKSHRNNVREMLKHPQVGDVYKCLWNVNDYNQQIGLRVKTLRINGDTMVVVLSKDIISEGLNYYDPKEWDKISNSAFDSKEYKMSLSIFRSGTNLSEYGNAENDYKSTLHGYVVGNGVSNLTFDVLERK